ncbi:oocyte zinc finger protein XlCOF29-like [Leptodactylus fuscus]|uniref:oocyte zinc finger protein XlCOF29-like n=1 Tax=Leptodactylus fuscus TaxID=238119 RepID=UPI003F4ECD90
MGKDRKPVAERILALTLEIICLLTGEDYTVVKKTSGERATSNSRPHLSGGWSRARGHITKSRQSLIHEQKILDLTNQIIELLTGEGEDLLNIKTEAFSGDEETYARWEEPSLQKEEPVEISTGNTDISPGSRFQSG